MAEQHGFYYHNKEATQSFRVKGSQRYNQYFLKSNLAPSITFTVNCHAPGNLVLELLRAPSTSSLHSYCQLRHYKLSLKIQNG